MGFEIREPRMDDLFDLASRLRASDVNEIIAASGMDPLAALFDSLETSDQCYVATLDGRPEVIFGTNELKAEWSFGGIWMLGTDAIEVNPLSFYRHCKKFLPLFHERYRYLTNFVDVNHHSAHRWMLKLGFQAVNFTTDYGPCGHPFIQYISEADNV
jgi:hypothetical protein